MIFSYLQNMQSHPSWVCGLKQEHAEYSGNVRGSHPSWVCGLKLQRVMQKISVRMSHPSWVCGLKHKWLVLLMFSDKCHTLRGCVD